MLLAVVGLSTPLSAHDVVADSEWPGLNPADRANPPGEETTKVEIKVDVWQILNIDERELLFEVDASITAQWEDIRLKSDDCTGGNRLVGSFEGEAASEILNGAIWAPEFYIVEGRSPRETRALSVSIACDGTVRYEERFVATVFQRFYELADFPFDRHTISFNVEPFGKTDRAAVRFFTFGTKPGAQSFDPSTWDSEEWNFETDRSSRMAVTENPPSVSIRIEIDRESKFYVTNVILPLFGIVAISWAVFWMKLDIAERLGVSITSLLTVVAFDFLTSDSLPKLSFTTRLDAFYNLSYLFILITALISIIAGRRLADDDMDNRIDRVSRIAVPATYCLAAAMAMVGWFSWGGTASPIEGVATAQEIATEVSEPESAVTGVLDDELIVGVDITATIETPDETDSYRVCTDADETTSIRMGITGSPIKEGDYPLDPLLLLFDTSGALVDENDDGAGSPPGFFVDSLIVIESAIDQCFLLWATDFYGDGIGEYKLIRTDGRHVPDIVVEQQSEAISLSGDETETGQVEAGTGTGKSIPSVVYELCLSVGETTSVRMEATATTDDVFYLDPFLVLLDETGERLDENDDGAGDLNSLLIIDPVEDQCYLIHASDLTGEGFGEFTLTTDPGVFEPPIAPGSADIGSGSLLVPGEATFGSIEQPGGFDSYNLCLAAGEVLTITMEKLGGSDPDATLDPYLVIYPDVDSVVEDDNGQGGLDSLVVLEPTTDQCYFVDAFDAFGDGVGAYVIHATPQG